MYEELKARLRAWCETSNCFGLDSIGKDVAQSLQAIEQLERQLAERDAEIAKYRDAPVVAYIPEQTINWLRRANSESAYCRCDVAKSAITSDYVPLIVKPGEQ